MPLVAYGFYGFVKTIVANRVEYPQGFYDCWKIALATSTWICPKRLLGMARWMCWSRFLRERDALTLGTRQEPYVVVLWKAFCWTSRMRNALKHHHHLVHVYATAMSSLQTKLLTWNIGMCLMQNTRPPAYFLMSFADKATGCGVLSACRISHRSTRRWYVQDQC